MHRRSTIHSSWTATVVFSTHKDESSPAPFLANTRVQPPTERPFKASGHQVWGGAAGSKHCSRYQRWWGLG